MPEESVSQCRYLVLIINRTPCVTSTIRATDLIGRIRRWLFDRWEGNAIYPAAGFQGLAVGSAPFDVYLIELAQGRVDDLWEFITVLDWSVFGVMLVSQDPGGTTTSSRSLGHRWDDIRRMERIVRAG